MSGSYRERRKLKDTSQMAVLFAIPFILLSIVCFAVCIFNPSLRSYALRMAVVPVAFGFCSVVGAFAIVVLSDKTLHIAALNEPLIGFRGVVTGIVIFGIPGAAGAWLASWLLGRLKARFSK